MTWGKRQKSIFMIIILIVSLFPLFITHSSQGELKDPSSLKNHREITILRNDEFTFEEGVVSGDGSKNNPYIIENWSIDVKGVNEGIEIRDTTAYFIVRNCYIYSSIKATNSVGMPITEIENGIFENNKIISTYRGIDFRDSSGIIFSNNTCNQMVTYGLSLRNCNNNKIINNTLNSNNRYGIMISESENNNFTNNKCKFNNKYGISCTSDSKNNLFSKNICNSNNETGLFVQSDNNNIIDNICNSNNESGIHVKSNNNVLLNNICNWNIYGIKLSNSVGTSLNNNSMSFCGVNIQGNLLKYWNTHNIDITNTVNGAPVHYWKNKNTGIIPEGAGEIILANCKNIKMFKQNISHGSIGILIGFTSKSSIINSNISDNYNGIQLYSSKRNIINNCSINSNNNYNFHLEYNSDNNIAINSTFNNKINIEYGSELIIKNYLHIMVNDSKNKPVMGADIQIIENDIEIYSTKGYNGNNKNTNEKGQIKWILVTDKIYSGGYNLNKIETIVNVKFNNIEAHNNNRIINTSISHFEYYKIQNVFPKKIDLINPYNNSFINISKPKLNWNASVDDNFDELTYIVQIVEKGSDWKSSILSKHTSIGILNWNLNISLNDGGYQWRVCANDGIGNGSWSDVWNFFIDTTLPQSKIAYPLKNGIYNNINNISGYASDLLNGSGVHKVEITIKRLNDNYYWNGSKWIEFESWFPVINTSQWLYNSSSIKWITDIYYNIRSRAIDNISNQEKLGSGINFMYDNKPPEISIIINNNTIYTNSINVTLSLTAEDTGSGVSNVAFSTNNSFWSQEEQFNNSKQFELPMIDGDKVIYYKVQDRANNSAIIQDSIILDTSPPYSLSVLINNGSLETNSKQVNLTLNAKDNLSGVSHMCFSNDGENWSDWEVYSDFKSFELSSEDSKKFIYYKVKDRAGNIANTISKSIILNTTIPKDNETPEKENPMRQSLIFYYFYILIIIIVIFLIIILLVMKRKKRIKQVSKDNEKIQQSQLMVQSLQTQAPSVTQTQPNLCPNCGQEMAFIQQYGGYQCLWCNI